MDFDKVYISVLTIWSELLLTNLKLYITLTYETWLECITILVGGFLVTNYYYDAGRKVSKSNLDRGRKQKRPLRQTAVDAWCG